MKRIWNDSTRRDEKRTSHSGWGTGGRLWHRLTDTPSPPCRQDPPTSPRPEFGDGEQNSGPLRADKYTCSDAQSDRRKRLAAQWRRANAGRLYCGCHVTAIPVSQGAQAFIFQQPQIAKHSLGPRARRLAHAHVHAATTHKSINTHLAAEDIHRRAKIRWRAHGEGSLVRLCQP